MNLIEDLKEAGELAASTEDYVRFDPRNSLYQRIITALEAAQTFPKRNVWGACVSCKSDGVHYDNCNVELFINAINNW